MVNPIISLSAKGVPFVGTHTFNVEIYRIPVREALEIVIHGREAGRYCRYSFPRGKTNAS